MCLQIKRIYEPAQAGDGRRILVDRLWPRGISKQRARLTEWMKDIAPSPALRQWFGHEAARMDVFSARYRAELAQDTNKQADIQRLLAMDKQGPVTLLYAAKDSQINHAVVLLAFLQEKQAGQ